MIVTQWYRYLGRNGTITTDIKLEKIEPILMKELKASVGKVLINGDRKEYVVTVFEDEVDDWKEIDDIGQK